MFLLSRLGTAQGNPLGNPRFMRVQLLHWLRVKILYEQLVSDLLVELSTGLEEITSISEEHGRVLKDKGSP